MNVKNNIKKVAAVTISAALVASTLVGAMAYDLSDYPAPFVKDGMAAGVIVVGANAATADVIGAIDIAASLQSKAVTGTSVAGSSEVSVEGGEDYNLNPNAGYAGATFDDADLEGFADSDAELEDTDYDFHEEIVIANNGTTLVTSIATSYADEDDYDLDAWMEMNANGVRYSLVFDDPVPLADFGTASDTQEMEVSFLGRTITIADVDTAGTITIESAAEYYMEEGDMVSIDGHDITLRRVGSTSVLVDVDGQTLSVSTSEEFDQADDFEVEVKSQFYIEGATDNSATLKLGSVISKAYDIGDALEIFDGNDDADEATWKWNVVENNTHLTRIEAVLNIDHDRNNNDNDPEKRAAIALGEELVFPNDYASISFAGWEDNAMSNTDTFTIEFDIEDLDTNTDENVIKITSSAEDAFTLGATDADVVWLREDSTFWYEDGSDETDSTLTSITSVLDDDTITFAYEDGTNDNITVTWPNGDVLRMAVVFDAAENGGYFGGTASDQDATDFTFTDGVSGDTFTSSEDGKVLSSYGVQFDDPEGMMDDDVMEFTTPHDGLQAKIIVKSKASVVSAGAAGGMSYSVNPIALGLGMLDTDAPALGSKPMIIVGGPAANTVAADFLGNPTSEEVLATFSEGKALIRYDDAKKAMLVAGWSAQDTQGAANVVAKYGDYDFAGNELEVVVTDLSNIQVNAVN